MTTSQLARCDVLCISYLRWDPAFARPQHLMARAARDRRVFYVEEPVVADGPPHLSIRRTTEGVMVVTPNLPAGLPPARVAEVMRGLIDHLIELQRVTRFVLWCYTPAALAFVGHLDPAAVVYDCMDDLTALGGEPDDLIAFEELLLVAADVVFAAGPGLHAALHHRHGNVHGFPNVVDAGHFVQARRLATREQPPSDQARIAAPRVGFVGQVDRRVDLELVAGLAELRPDVALVMIGPLARSTQAALPRRPNVHWLGTKTYDELPYYLAGWAAAMFPYVRDSSTRRLVTTRIPECLAAGRAVITTSVPDLVQPFRDLGLVRVADTPRAFSDAIDAVRSEAARDRNRRADRWLAQVSWDRTWAAMDGLVEAAIADRDPDLRGLRLLRIPA